MNKDLTSGQPSVVLWKFCLPLFGSIIFQQLYNIADSFVAGKFISNDALAAVGNSYEITLIFLAFAFGCNIGCSVIVSQLFGAKRYGELKTSVYTTLISSAVLCLLLMIVGLTCTDFILNLINTPLNIYADSKLYLDIYVLGLPFVFFYNVATGIFSALGDSKTPFFFLAFSSIGNIIVDIIFVVCFHMGVDGVAWATLLCQGISCILELFFVFKRFSKIPSEGKVDIFSFSLLRKISIIAIPSIIQQSFISVGNIIIQGVINGFGSSVIAGYSASIKLNNMVITSLTTIGNGISNYTAQNIGAGKLDRVKEGLKAGFKMVVTISIPIIIIYFSFTKNLVSIFLENPSGEALDSGITFLKIVSPFYIIIAIKLVSDGMLRGAGLMKKFMLATFIDLFLRIVIAMFLSKTNLATVGIWIAWPISWTISSIISYYFASSEANNHNR